MKRLALVVAVFALAACTAKKDEAVTDTAAPAMTPAPAAMDSAAVVDTTVKIDTTVTDTTKK